MDKEDFQIMIRLQKFISDSGYTSRRKAEELISAGRVTVNGVVATIGIKVDENSCDVRIDGNSIKKCETKIYIMLNKPTGYLSSVTDDRGRKTVIDLIDNVKERVFPVGRLDYDTEGLLILTNDGEFTYQVTHPKHQIRKTYLAAVDKNIDENDMENLLKGVKIDNYIAKANKIEIYDENKYEYLITISQGKNRQVRKMFEAVGTKVIKLKRICIGSLNLGALPRGKWKYLSFDEINRIFK